MPEAGKLTSTQDRRTPARFARVLASPAGVLVILPALVIASGITVLSLGRSATRETAETMARHQLVAQAKAVEHDVTFSLEQAEPVLATMETLAAAAMPTPDALTRLYDAVRGRPGVYNATIAFPIGVTWGAYFDDDNQPRVHESRVADTTRVNYKVTDGRLQVIATRPDSYDPRTRPYYKAAVVAGKRVWLPPRVFQASGKTGLTVAEPLYADGKLAAVITIDYDVAALSAFLTKAPLEGAYSVMFTADGTILAHSSSAKVPDAAREKRLLRHADFGDPALDALFATDEVMRLVSRDAASGEPQFLRLATRDGDYLASIAVVGDRTKTSTPLTGYLATLVPESSLLAAMHRLDRTSIIASAVALAIAMAIALVFAWNLVRMRRAVGVARAEARSAEARAKQLGSYKLVERLGLGGQGEVWRAEHQLLARRAAIKLVRNDVAAGPDAAQVQERFKREAQTLASMKSRHTIELYDYGVTDDGTFFYVMELLDGLDLSQLVRAHGPLPAARVISVVAQACQSLGEAHDAGLLHRDIKPANLVLCRAADEVDILKVLDFGIVHNVAEPVAPMLSKPPRDAAPSADSRLTVEGAVIGTPGYIPPEQATAQPLDPRGDVYSLACVAWYLLTAAEVFGGSTVDDILRAHVDAPIPTLRPLVKGWLPVELEALIVRCLAKYPEDRPDARELAKALREIEIPAEHAWTEHHAIEWWAEPRVVATPKSEAATAAGGGILVAHHAPPTSPSSTADAQTLVARPSSNDVG